MTPINRRRIAIFRSSRRGVYSLVVFGLLFFLSLFAELLANDKPILIYYDGGFYSPLIRDYPVMFGTLYFFGLIGLIMGIVGDLMYTVVDPRVDFEARQ